MNIADFELLKTDTLDEHVFDIVINRAPSQQTDLGFYCRTDGELVVHLKVPAPPNASKSSKGLRNANSSTGSRRKKRSNDHSKNKSSSSSSNQNSTASDILEIGLTQNMSLLNSNKESSTTGAMLWRVSVIFAEWFYEHFYYGSNPLFIDSTTNLSSHGEQNQFDVVELGCGATALLPLALGSSTRIRRYIATDQGHIVKLARQNIERHYLNDGSGSGVVPENIRVVEYDWEMAKQDIPNIAEQLNDDSDTSSTDEENPDLLVIACDTIYNEYLIPHFLDALARVCALASSTQSQSRHGSAHVLVAQQVRDPDIMESFLSQFVGHPQFQVWSIPESCLTAEFKQGFVLHYAKFIESPSE